MFQTLSGPRGGLIHTGSTKGITERFFHHHLFILEFLGKYPKKKI